MEIVEQLGPSVKNLIHFHQRGIDFLNSYV